MKAKQSASERIYDRNDTTDASGILFEKIELRWGDKIGEGEVEGGRMAADFIVALFGRARAVAGDTSNNACGLGPLVSSVGLEDHPLHGAPVQKAAMARPAQGQAEESNHVENMV
jgi:hypothetical protein